MLVRNTPEDQPRREFCGLVADIGDRDDFPKRRPRQRTDCEEPSRRRSLPIDDRAVRTNVDADAKWIDAREALVEKAEEQTIGRLHRVFDDARAVDDSSDIHALDTGLAAPAIADRGARRILLDNCRLRPSAAFSSTRAHVVDRETIERENKRLVTQLKFARLRQSAVGPSAPPAGAGPPRSRRELTAKRRCSRIAHRSASMPFMSRGTAARGGSPTPAAHPPVGHSRARSGDYPRRR